MPGKLKLLECHVFDSKQNEHEMSMICQTPMV
jgi:hypothetical protein